MLVDWYLWIKAFHIMAVISWMAGLFYLPRIFVYHAERKNLPEPVQSFEIMEKKLLRVIMTPAMIAAWAAGLLLASMPGVVNFSQIWVWAKLAGILAMTGFHHWLAAEHKRLVAGTAQLTGRHYRMINEIPTLLMVIIVLSVIVKF